MNSTLEEWLRNERRLGVPHYPVRFEALTQPLRPLKSGDVTTRDRARGSAAAASRVEGAETGLRQPYPAEAHAFPVRASPPLTTLSFLSDDPDLPPPCAHELPPAEADAALARLDADFVTCCTKCSLHEHRRQTVFGVGHCRAELVFVGEGPGAEEDAQGLPFVGRAGQLLTRMIAAMTLTREQVYICNVVKCRPPSNRTPTEEEMKTCVPYLFRQLAILRPKVIATLGRPASQTLLATKVPISRLRGQLHDFPPPTLAHLGLPATKLMPTFHPAYLLRSPGEKAKAWEDLQAVMRILGLKIPKRR